MKLSTDKTGAPVLKPFPDAASQNLAYGIKYVQSMEIDSKGRMWVLDTGRCALSFLDVGLMHPGRTFWKGRPLPLRATRRFTSSTLKIQTKSCLTLLFPAALQTRRYFSTHNGYF
jgi:hypothetical protein